MAEKEELGTPERLEEEAALKALLAPLGLGVKEIRVRGRGGWGEALQRLAVPCRWVGRCRASSVVWHASWQLLVLLLLKQRRRRS